MFSKYSSTQRLSGEYLTTSTLREKNLEQSLEADALRLDSLPFQACQTPPGFIQHGALPSRASVFILFSVPLGNAQTIPVLGFRRPALGVGTAAALMQMPHLCPETYNYRNKHTMPSIHKTATVVHLIRRPTSEEKGLLCHLNKKTPLFLFFSKTSQHNP